MGVCSNIDNVEFMKNANIKGFMLTEKETYKLRWFYNPNIEHKIYIFYLVKFLTFHYS